MPVTAWKFAGAGSSDSSFGDSFSDWSSPGNITAEDGTEATASLSTNSFADESEYLKGLTFGFTASDIPTDATIDGIELRIKRRQLSASGVNDIRVRLVKGGTIQTTDRADTGTNWPTTLTKKTYGGSSDLWGSSWTPSDIHSSNFGAVMSCGQPSSSASARVDSYEIRVHYTEAAAEAPNAPFFGAGP